MRTGMVREKIRLLFRGEKDITNGNIPKNIIALALPLMIGAMLHSMQSLIDIFWVGRLGPNAIGAVAMSATVMMFVFTLSLGIGIGTLSLVAKNIGAQRRESAEAVASQSIFLVIMVGIIAAVAGYFFSETFLRWLGADTAVVVAGANYLRILLMGCVIMLLLFTVNYILQGAGDVIYSMSTFVLANILNIILDPLFIFGIGMPRMGVSGAALATVLSQAISLTVVFVILS